MLRRSAVVLSLVSFMGCAGSDSPPVEVDTTVAPTLSAFTPSVTTTVAGSETRVSWSWAYAKPPSPEPACTIDQGVGLVRNGGETAVKLASDTTFTLTCTSSAGTASATTSITVTQRPVPPVVGSFVTSPASITAGVATSVGFSWSFSNGPSPTPTCTIDQGVGAADGNGTSRTLTLTRDTRYVLTCSSLAGAASAATTLRVTPAPVAPKPTGFAVTPGSVVSGIATSIEFTWGYDGVPTSTPTCTIDNGVGAATSGATTDVTLTAATTYTLTCTSAEGTGTATTTLEVRPQVAPVVGTVTLGPDTVLTGSPTAVSFSWTYANAPVPAPTCTISSGVGAISNGGVTTVNLTADTAFTVTCTNSAGSGSATKVLKVVSAPVAPVVTTFAARPSSVVQGEPTRVSFAFGFAATPVPSPTCLIDQSFGPAGTFKVLTLDTDTLYTISCANSAGTGTASTTMTVIPATPPVFTSFGATPTPAELGTRKLTWSWSYAVEPRPKPSCIIDHGVGPVSPGDTTTITLDADVDFTLTCTNPGGAESATSTVTTFARAVAVASSSAHACALLSHGAVWCWGYNGNRALGNPAYAQSATPIPVIGLTDAIAIAVGEYHTCALTRSGGVKCWGANWYGQLGTGDTGLRSTPADVLGLSSGVVAIGAGGVHTCAIRDDGSTWCWGDNGEGQLGDGTTSSSSVPVLTGANPAQSVAASFSNTCVRNQGGGVQCWGHGHYGELGNGTTVASYVPVSVVGLRSSATDLAVGQFHACVVLDDGTAKCWGYGRYGQLGNSASSSSRPIDVVGITDAAGVRAGGYSTCVRRHGGELACFGRNDYGQLGDGSLTDRSSPALVDLPSPVVDMGLGSTSACAVLDSGHVSCWGRNDAGQIGDGTMASVLWPTRVEGLHGAAQTVAAGRVYSCAGLASGIDCWGGEDRELGTGGTTRLSPPVSVLNPPSVTAELHAGFSDTCVRGGDGALLCWGGGLAGTAYPSTVLPSGVTAFGLGYSSGCAVVDGGAKCFGENSHGQLGDGSTKSSWGYDQALKLSRYLPVQVQGLDAGVAGIATGYYHACAALTAGGVKCWGYNYYGQLGASTGTAADSLTPVDVGGLTEGVSSLGLGAYTSCAVTLSGGLKCWGHGYPFGQGSLFTATDVPGLTSGVASVAITSQTLCAIMQTGELRCMGSNSGGRAGLGSTTFFTTPTVVTLPDDVASATLSEEHGCAALTNGDVYCWGRDHRAQVTGVYPLDPRAVVGIGP